MSFTAPTPRPTNLGDPVPAKEERHKPVGALAPMLGRKVHHELAELVHVTRALAWGLGKPTMC